jgi:sec-independent protein translocase protein TatB
MFGIGFEKLFVLAVFGAILIGPDRLPKAAADLARFIAKIRSLGQQAAGELKEQLGPEFQSLNTQDLNPKKFIQNNLDEISKSIDPFAKDVKRTIKESTIDPDLL